MKTRLTPRRIIAFIIIVLLIFVARPVGFLIYTHYNDHRTVENDKPGFINDASHLNETKIEAIIKVPGDINAAITQISQLIKKASEQNKKISIAGALTVMCGSLILLRLHQQLNPFTW